MVSEDKYYILWRKLRLSMDLNQKEFGLRLGVGAGYISEIESGKKEPSITLSKLFRYIEMETHASMDNIKDTSINKSMRIDEIQKTEEMLRLDLIKAQKKIIELLEENSLLKEKLLEKPKQIQAAK
jgi:transcriptional regulator with XRE-family HTH domain